MSLIYPKYAELSRIGPAKVARAIEARLGFQLCPMRDVGAGIVEWVQKDNFRGLQQLRGMDGKPSVIARVGDNRYSYMPGVYGEFGIIGETELTLRRGSAPSDTPIDVTDLVLELQDQTIQSEIDRIEQCIWTLFTTGTLSVPLPNGATGFKATFAIQTNSGSDWSTVATATPLADFRAVQLLGRGKGAGFGSGAMAVMNRKTANYLLANTNAADLGGKLVNAGSSIIGVADVNKVAVAQDTPDIVIYDEGYYDAANTWTNYIPDDKVVVFGKRPSGEKIAEYVKTRNANNPGEAPGSYQHVKDTTGNAPEGQRTVPAHLEVHRGHNGGPVIYFPGSIVIMSV